jgi:hypothetical protein
MLKLWELTIPHRQNNDARKSLGESRSGERQPSAKNGRCVENRAAAALSHVGHQKKITAPRERNYSGGERMKPLFYVLFAAMLITGCSTIPIKLQIGPLPISSKSMDGEISKVNIVFPKDFREVPLITSSIVSEWKDEISLALEASKALSGKLGKRIIVNIDLEKMESYNLAYKFDIVAIYTIIEKDTGIELYKFKIESTGKDNTFYGESRYVLSYINCVSINVEKFIAAFVAKLNS